MWWGVIGGAPAAVPLAGYRRPMLNIEQNRLLVLAPPGVALVGTAYFARKIGVAQRVGHGVHDVCSYLCGGNVFSNRGIRLALWTAAAMLIAELPVRESSINSAEDASLLAMAETTAVRPLLGKALAPLLGKGFSNNVKFSLSQGASAGLSASRNLKSQANAAAYCCSINWSSAASDAGSGTPSP